MLSFLCRCATISTLVSRLCRLVTAPSSATCVTGVLRTNFVVLVTHICVGVCMGAAACWSWFVL